MDVGGQAVIEGVMMRTKDRIAVCIRKNGKIVTHKKDSSRINCKIPFIRGVFVLFDAVINGTKALMWSAQQADDEGLSDAGVYTTVFVSFAFAIFLFIGIPFFVSNVLNFGAFGSDFLFRDGM